MLSAHKPGGKPAGEDPNQGELYPTDPVNGAPAADAAEFSAAGDDVDTGADEDGADS